MDKLYIERLFLLSSIEELWCDKAKAPEEIARNIKTGRGFIIDGRST